MMTVGIDGRGEEGKRGAHHPHSFRLAGDRATGRVNGDDGSSRGEQDAMFSYVFWSLSFCHCHALFVKRRYANCVIKLIGDP